MIKFLTAVTCFALFVVASPIVERMQDTLVYEAAVTQTCWDIHGLYFPGRWSCRSTFNQLGATRAGIACAIYKNEGPLCRNIEMIGAANKFHGGKR